MRRAFFALVILLAAAIWSAGGPASAAQSTSHTVQPGDTWPALAARYGVAEAELRALNFHLNHARQPAIGRTIALPPESGERSGQLARTGEAGLLALSLQTGQPIWRIAVENGLDSPYQPTFHRPLLLTGEGVIRDLPPGITALELYPATAEPGRALGLRGNLNAVGATIAAELDSLRVNVATKGRRFAGVVGTGAFYGGGEPELVIKVGDAPAWTQPWAFQRREWEFQQLTLTGEAAQIDQQARDEERARLQNLWTTVTPDLQWTTPFATPINNFLQVSANYGARRSYNGGPYLTYHEGVDFSAYAGTPVVAPAAGTVVLAERLYVRGGAVIIDHGLGIFSGYYHLSAVHATPGAAVEPGDVLGEVGTTGLSTGNHLHWDILINGIWVDAAAWQQDDMACWLLDGLGASCATE